MQEWIYYMIVASMILIAIACFFSRNKALRDKKHAQKHLEDTLSNLEAVYSEVNTTQEELNAKYKELKTSEEKIKKLAYEDAMTGLPNKAAFLEVLEHTMATLRKDESIAVMYLDLDNFKDINDMWGHSCGDELILDVSHRLKQNLDDNDYLARSGSDEFLILTQNIIDVSYYEEKLKRLQKAFRFPFVLSVSEFVITTSIGIVLAPKDGKTANGLMKHADSALNQAKWLGKDTYCYYTDALEQKQLEDMELRSELTVAMKQNDFFLRYQPYFDLNDNICLGFRLELRWDRKDKGIWRARKFIRFAEETGQIVALGERAFRKACKDIKMWESEGKPNYTIVVPVTKRQFFSQNFSGIIQNISMEEEASLEHFLFELPEKILTRDYDDSLFLMKDRKDKGFRFRIGDFGGGHMSMDCVRDMPVEQVAIQVSRIFAEREEQEAIQYLTTIVNAVLALGKQVVITDVSDAMEEKWVKEQGSWLVQGDLYGESLSAAEVLADWQLNVF